MITDNNIIPFKKTDKFILCRGTMGPNEELTEFEQVGVAYLKTGSKNFRIKLWFFPNQQYFLVPTDEKCSAYNVLSLEEYQSQSNEKKASWQTVGKAEYIGLHIKMKFYLLSEEVYLCLFPDQKQSEEFHAAG